MKIKIDHPLLKKKNIQIENEIMDNHEERFRIKLKEGSGINITDAFEETGWQNAHFHKHAKEMYIVEEGEIVLAYQEKNEIVYLVLSKGDAYLIEPFIEHNVYMKGSTRTIVIKFGKTQEEDWHYAEVLDKETKKYVVKG